MMDSRPHTLVTGGTGFLGRHLLAAAVEDLEIWTLGRRCPDQVAPERHIRLDNPAAAGAIREAVRIVQPELVIHLAGVATGDLATMHMVNAVFAGNLLAALAAEQPAARVFLAGSAAEYGPIEESDLPVTEAASALPRDAYGITKLAQTLHGLAAADHGLGVAIGRLFNVIGAGMPEHLALGSFAAQIARMGPEGGQLMTGDLDVERDFISATDAAHLILALLKRPDAAGVFNLCSGVPLNLRRLVEELVRQCGRPIMVRRDPDRRGVTTLRRHFGAPMRLRSLGLPVPVLNPRRIVSEILPERRN